MPDLKSMPYEEWTLCDCGDTSDGPHYAERGGIKHWYADDLANRKRLTDTECAAEYWRVCADMAGNAPTVVSPAVIQKHIRVWERFVTHLHAAEVEE